MAEETPNPGADAAPTGTSGEAQPAAAAPEPVVPLTPKERKVAARARRGKRRASTPEERAEVRKAKAAARSRRRLQEREKARAARAEAGPAKTTPPAEKGTGTQKIRQGIVTSDKADKTITVRVVESRPLSATKRWRLLDVLERAK